MRKWWNCAAGRGLVAARFKPSPGGRWPEGPDEGPRFACGRDGGGEIPPAGGLLCPRRQSRQNAAGGRGGKTLRVFMPRPRAPVVFYGGSTKEAGNLLPAQAEDRTRLNAPPTAQPLAALPPYGCGVPLAGAAVPGLLKFCLLLQEAARLRVCYRGTAQVMWAFYWEESWRRAASAPSRGGRRPGAMSLVGVTLSSTAMERQRAADTHASCLSPAPGSLRPGSWENLRTQFLLSNNAVGPLETSKLSPSRGPGRARHKNTDVFFPPRTPGGALPTLPPWAK